MIDLRRGDCVERMAELPADSIDLVLTSPPYDNLRRYGSGSAFDFEGLADQIKRTLKPGGVCVWIVGDETKDGSESGTSFRQALHFKAIGLRLHDTMIYRKTNYVPLTHRRYEQEFEFAFVASKGKPKTFNPLLVPCQNAGKVNRGTHYIDGRALSPKNGSGRLIKAMKPRGNVWSYSVGSEANGHPAVFPLQLAVDHILSWTNPDDLVVDPFVGSGTTLEACLKTGRRGIGFDKDADYLAIARKRIKAARAVEVPA